MAGDGISRRTVLLGLGGAATAALVAVAAGVALTDDDPSADQPGDVTRDAVIRIGAAYRAAYPADDDREMLRREVGDLGGLSGADLADRLATLDERVRADFAAGNVVLVDGWLLARTEARAAALVSLVA
jgi:hypothetical protein